MKKLLLVAIFSSVFLVQSAQADFVSWTDWTSADGSTNWAVGAITLPDTSTIGVSYSGGLFSAQTTPGTNYYNPDVYSTHSLIDNAPDSLNTDIVRAGEGTGGTITFSEAVLDPIMAIVSLNGPYLTFDTPFEVLSYGTGFWGTGNLVYGAGNTLTSNGEGHGVIRFSGSFTSISFSESGFENWRGFTIGILDKGAPVPEPTTMLLLGTGLLGLAGARRRIRR